MASAARLRSPQRRGGVCFALDRPGNLSAISPAVLQKFAADNMAPNRMVLAAAGYDHQELVALAQAR